MYYSRSASAVYCTHAFIDYVVGCIAAINGLLP